MGTMQDSNKHIAVIGAGMVGVSCALHLQRAGHKVTLVDLQEPGEGASFGNAGVVGCSSIIPVPVPGVIKKLPGMLLDSHGPLSINLPYAATRPGWFLSYIKAANQEKVESIAQNLAELLTDSMEQHRNLSEGTGAEQWLHDSNYIFAYGDRSGYESDSYVWNLRKQKGIEFRTLEASELRDLAPGISDDFKFAVVFEKKHGYISNPGMYIKTLVKHFTEQGGIFQKRKVNDIVPQGADGKVELRCENGVVETDQAVVCCGIWSRQLMERVGSKYPLESERGYHLMFKNHNLDIRGPIMSTKGKCVVTPMEEGLRVAGLAEFSGLEGKHNEAFASTLLKHVKDMFPQLQYDEVSQWHGHRPSFPDSLPVIGELPDRRNVFVAFGHQHIGLMSGPKTGALLTDVLCERRPAMNMSPFDPARFA